MKRKETFRLAVIGGGKMGEALVRGLLRAGGWSPGRISVGDPDPARRDHLRKAYGVGVSESNSEIVPSSDLCLLVVKPQEMERVLEEIGPVLSSHALVVSVAAGISTDWIRRRLAGTERIARAMPNAAALVGMSATGLYFRPSVTRRERKRVLGIFDAVGETVVVEKEELLHAVTGLSGSGPAYVFLFLESLTEAGVALGLSRDLSARLALQTVLGSAAMARELEEPFSVLKGIITSPGGTTMAGLRVLESGAIRALLMDAVEEAAQRSEELSP